MHSSQDGFTMIEMCIVLSIVAVLFCAFALPVAHQSHGLIISVKQLQSFLEMIQNDAVADGKVYKVLIEKNEAVSEKRQLVLPKGITCSRACMYVYPQYTSTPAFTVTCSDHFMSHKIVVQLGRGRSEIR